MSQTDDGIEYAIKMMVSKGRVMQSGTIVIDGRKFDYKFKYQKPNNMKEWEEALKEHKKGVFLPNYTKRDPIDPLGRCDLCNAPIYEGNEEEQENYCWNCGVEFV